MLTRKELLTEVKTTVIALLSIKQNEFQKNKLISDAIKPLYRLILKEEELRTDYATELRIKYGSYNEKENGFEVLASNIEAMKSFQEDLKDYNSEEVKHDIKISEEDLETINIEPMHIIHLEEFIC